MVNNSWLVTIILVTVFLHIHLLIGSTLCMHVCESIKPFLSFQKVLMTELRANWRDQLLEFDMKPFAAASIGQVHRGVLKDGRPVAIKIQVRGLHNLQHFNVRGLSLLLILVCAPRGFPPRTLVFPSPQKTNISKFQFNLLAESHRFVSHNRLLSVTLIKQTDKGDLSLNQSVFQGLRPCTCSTDAIVKQKKS